MHASSMANTTAKILVIIAILVVLQVSSAIARRRGDSAAAEGGGGDTPATMTVNGFQRGESGGGPSECDGHYHSDKEMLAALSTGWYANGSWCFKKISITSTQTGRTVEATVVDECDSHRGCKDNIVDTSKAVRDALGLDTNVGEVPVTWSDA